jgi:hypothetical protein
MMPTPGNGLLGYLARRDFWRKRECMAAFKMTEDPEVFFVFARQMLSHAALQAPPGQFVLGSIHWDITS